MNISARIRNLWREVEDILTAATGPILILASALAAADIFSNHVFSDHYTWIPAAWAVARALAVTIWLGIAWEFYLQARTRGGGGWWLLLALALFGVDLQTALLFAIEDEHLATVGGIPLVTIPAVYWAFEQAVLGVVLIAVHRAVDHQTHQSVTELAPARLNTQPASEAVVAGQEEGPGVLRGGAPSARRADWRGPLTPLISEDERDVVDLSSFVTVSDEEKPQSARRGGMTGHTGKSGKQRRDVGRQSAEVDLRKRRIVREMLSRLEDGAVMTIEDVADFTGMSRGTSVSDRAGAFDILKHEHAAEWAAIQQLMAAKKRLRDV